MSRNYIFISSIYTLAPLLLSACVMPPSSAVVVGPLPILIAPEPIYIVSSPSYQPPFFRPPWRPHR